MERDIRRFTPGSRIILEGETSSEIFILLSGELAIWRGRMELGRLSGKGDVIGELAAFTKRPRAATVVAVTDVEMLVVPVDLKAFSRRSPDALEKIDATIAMRYEIARQKAIRYAECAALERRSVLHEALVQAEMLRQGSKQSSGEMRRNIRRRLDDAISLHGDPGDPRALKKIADEYSVLTDYSREINSNPWLDDSIALRLEEIENRFRLCSADRDLNSIRERAAVTAEMLDILGEYESLDGMLHHMMLMKLESKVPIDVKISTLRSLVMKKVAEEEDQTKIFQERKVLMAVEKEKYNAGKDLVVLYRTAREMSVEADYLEELKRLVALSDSSSSFIDLVPV